jgi:hypothetical protein
MNEINYFGDFHMKLLATLSFFTLHYFAIPIYAMDEANRQYPDTVSIAGLKHEHVLLALWNNATGGDNTTGQMLYLASNASKRPTEQQATQYLTQSSGGYFHMRKIAPPHGDTYYCKPFNDNHGKGRAQLIIQALRNHSAAAPLTLEDIFKIYIPSPMELGKEEDSQVQALRKAGNFEEANKIHSDALRKAEDDKMKKLVAEGKIEEAFAIHRARSQREDAEVGGHLMRSLASEGTPEERAAAQAFNRGMAMRLAGLTGGKPSSSSTPDMSPPPASSPSHQTRTETPNNDFSEETQKVLAKGLRGMFGGSTAKSNPPK